MLTHLSDGTVRRYLDEPAAVSDTERTHLSGCSRCQAELEAAEADRDLVARALTTVAGPDLDDAWTTLRSHLDDAPEPGRQPEPVTPAPAADRRRPRLAEHAVRRPLAAAVAAGVVLLGGGAAAAATGWLPVFRAEKVTPVQVSPQDLGSVDQLMGQWGDYHELSAFGNMVGPTATQPSSVPDAAAATARTGLPAPRVSKLPKGVQGNPSYLVMDRQTVQFTFSADKAAQAAKARGTTLPPMPAGLDGTRVQLQAGPGIAELWEAGSAGPSLVVATVKAPTAATQGASLQVLRDYLLTMPGISSQLAAQLRTVTSDGTTLPIPVPTDLATSSQADVGGVQATVVESKNQFGAGVIWVDGADIKVVGGLLGKSEVLAVARGLG